MQGGKQVEGERRPSVEEFSRLIRGAFRVLLLLFLGLVLVEFGFVLKTGIGTLDFSLSIAGLALLAGANVVFLRSIAGQSEIIESIQKSGRVIPAILITLEAALAVLVAGIFHSIASGYGVPDETYN